MKKFLYVLIILSFITIPASSEDKNVPLTHNQKSFVSIATKDRAYSKAEWVNSLVLSVTVSQTYSGVLDLQTAKLGAIMLATEGYLYTEKNICVKITDPEFGELAYECMGDQSET